MVLHPCSHFSKLGLQGLALRLMATTKLIIIIITSFISVQIDCGARPGKSRCTANAKYNRGLLYLAVAVNVLQCCMCIYTR